LGLDLLEIDAENESALHDSKRGIRGKKANTVCVFLGPTRVNRLYLLDSPNLPLLSIATFT